MAVSLKSALKTISNKIINLNNNKVDTAAVATMLNSTLAITPTVVTPASGWTITPNTSYLIGADKLYVACTAKGTFSAGNINNITLATISVKTGGRISKAYDFATNTSATGIMGSMGLVIQSLSGTGENQVLTFTWNLYATHAAGSSATLTLNSYIPVQPNVSYYNI